MESTSLQPIRDNKDLHVWQKGTELAKQVYLLTNRFPSEEKFGLVSQMRRAAISVPSNIAEGAARNFGRELYRYLGIAMGSLAELETQLELAIRLKYLPEKPEVFSQVRRVGRLVNGLRNSCEGWVAQD